MKIDDIIDLTAFPINDADFRENCRNKYSETGALVMEGFVTQAAIKTIQTEALASRHLVYADTKQHTAYLSPTDGSFSADHPRNRLVTSSKGCITDDQISRDSALRTLYDSDDFRSFLKYVLGEKALFPYADPMSSINLHYAEKGQELGWHFDNSSFAITLMVQPPEQGGSFEYVSNSRNSNTGEMGFEAVAAVLDGTANVSRINADEGTIVFFNGRDSLHRVSPNEGDITRLLAVLAYNAEPGVSLSKEAQKTFYGRVA